MAAAPHRRLFVVRSAAEWAAINSPVRMEMVVFLIAAGTCAIRELALLMNRPADGLYHHMRKLVRAGLVVEVDTRRVGKQSEMLYRAAADDVVVDRNLQSRATRDRTRKLFRTIMQHAQRTIEVAIASGAAVLEGRRRNVSFNWLASWLDETQLARVRAHHDAIHAILLEGVRRREGQLMAVLTYMAPIHRPREAKTTEDLEK